MTATELAAAQIGSNEQTQVHSEVFAHLVCSLQTRSSTLPSHVIPSPSSEYRPTDYLSLLLPETHLQTGDIGGHSDLCQVTCKNEGSSESPRRWEGKPILSELDVT